MADNGAANYTAATSIGSASNFDVFPVTVGVPLGARVLHPSTSAAQAATDIGAAVTDAHSVMSTRPAVSNNGYSGLTDSMGMSGRGTSD